MRTRRIIFSLLSALVVSTGCTLQRESFEEIYPENFFRNQSDIDKALIALYTPFSTGWGKFYCCDQYSYLVVSDMTAGVMASRWTGQDYRQYYEHWWEEDIQGWVRTFMNDHYKQYNHLSRIMSVIKKIEESTASDEVKLRSIAEAKCLYGWLGYIMYDLFGPVPLITDEAMDDPQAQIFIPRLSDEEYVAVMIGMLDDAIESGTLSVRASAWGRMSESMAMMLKLKFLMARKDYVAAEEVARDLYALRGNPFDLMDSYQSIFDKANVKNREIIHAIPCGIEEDFPNYWMVQVLPWSFKGKDGTGSEDAQGWQTFAMTWDFYESFEPGDERLETIIAEYTYIDGNGASIVYNRNNDTALKDGGPIPFKYGNDPQQNGVIGTTDQIVFRFSDVMLSLAECINMNDGPTDEAKALLNEVRDRVGLLPIDPKSKDAFNEALLNERLHEFHCEGLARTDKIRFGTFVSDAIAQYPDSRSAPHKVRFPIPGNYIAESEGVVKQNPGY